MTVTNWFATSLCSLGLLLAACGGSSDSGAPAGAPSVSKPTLPNAEVIGETIATVNGMPIGTNEFDALAARKMRGGELDAEVRQEILDGLVEEKLLYQEALAQGLDKDPKIQRMMVNTLLKQDVYSSVKTSDITEDDLLAYFEEHKEDFVVPEKAQVKRIIVEPEGDDPTAADEAAWAAAKERIDGIREQVLARKADFRKLAQDNSAGAYARRGGDLGFVTRDGKPGIPQEVIDAAFTLEKGGVSEPFRTERGWNIVYVPNRRERVERTYEQMRGSVLRKVKQDTYKELYEGYVGKLRQGANVDVNQSMLSSHQVKAGRNPMLGAPGDEPDAASPDEDERDEALEDEE